MVPKRMEASCLAEPAPGPPARSDSSSSEESSLSSVSTTDQSSSSVARVRERPPVGWAVSGAGVVADSTLFCVRRWKGFVETSEAEVGAVGALSEVVDWLIFLKKGLRVSASGGLVTDGLV